MRNQLESKLQIACVKWFDLQYPKLKLNLFSIPNEGSRSPANGARMKAQGRRAGTADMFLAVERKPYINIDGKCFNLSLLAQYSGLFIEFKFGKGKQSDAQKQFQKSVIEKGYRYEIITDFDSFKNLITEYLK